MSTAPNRPFPLPSPAPPPGGCRRRSRGRLRAGLLGAGLLGLLAAVPLTTPAEAGTTGVLPGRPPVGPLARDVGRVHDLTFRVRLNARPPYRVDVEDQRGIGESPYFINRPTDDDFIIDGGVFVMPVPVISTWHRTQLETLGAVVMLDDRRITDAGDNGRMRRSLPYDVQRAEIPIPAFTGQVLGMEWTQRTTVWASVLDDAAAMMLPWPERYPEDVEAGLDPSPGIPSSDPFFAGVVQQLFGADVTAVAPYLAAKRIAGHVARNFDLVGPRIYRGIAGTIDGMVVRDTIAAARDGRGNPVDLICITVATMRAAGIPARPVFGVTAADDTQDEIRDRETLTAWAEFYLEGAGWVPFDPEELRSNGSWRNLPPDRAWPNFGTWDELNERIPMAYDFFPGSDVRAAQRPAIYGVRLEGGAETVPAQYISISLVSRGRV